MDQDVGWDYVQGIFDEMQVLINRQDWEGLEALGFQGCSEFVDEGVARSINAIDFDSYQRVLHPLIQKAVLRARELNVAAIYFEYNSDNLWQSDFFLCDQYFRRDEKDEDWACEWVEEVHGPDFSAAAEIYESYPYRGTIKSTWPLAFLVARTVCALGRCVEVIDIERIAVCIGFHDQDVIMRLTDLPKSVRRPRKKRPEPQQLDAVANYIIQNYQDLVPISFRSIDVTDKPPNYRQSIIDSIHAKNRDKIFLNFCPKCNQLCRTPAARQCWECGHVWRDSGG